MEILKASSFRSFRRQPNEPIPIRNPSNLFKIPCTFPRFTKIKPPTQKSDLKTFTATSPITPWDEASPPPEQEAESEKKEEKFDWYENWYPVAPVCDLDKRRPHGKRVIGIDVVVWWDRNEDAWKVFDDSCPHRLAPLSEGRIDQSGRLQCVYHGWCFGGAGDCKFIPQAPRDGPPVHSWKKACVQGVYPSCVQNEMVWFWPNSDPQYKDIYLNKKPPYIPELGDPSFTNSMMSREIPYGYEVLTENFMDPAHVPYAHYGVLEIEKVAERCTVKSDREGGREIEFSVGKVDVNGFSAKQLTHANYYFIPPCLYYGRIAPHTTTTTTTTKDATIPLVPLEKTIVLIFYCIPVSPGCSRVIFASPRNFAVQIDRILPRWISHIKENLILDSDLFLLHLEERKLKDLDWHKSCYTPTSSDAQILAFRRWLNKYGGTQVDWRNKFPATLPPTPPREQLMDRYWSHTVSCSSCSLAYKLFNALDIGLQVISIASIAVAAISTGARYSLASMAVLCFVASKWLSRFIYKTFRYHGYDHAFK